MYRFHKTHIFFANVSVVQHIHFQENPSNVKWNTAKQVHFFATKEPLIINRSQMKCPVKNVILFYFFYFTYADSRLWWTAEVLSSARQTRRFDHLSFTWQQQKSWNCVKLLLGDKGNCWLEGVWRFCEAAVEQDSFPNLRRKQTSRKWLKL
jgi:hypothetical protein